MPSVSVRPGASNTEGQEPPHNTNSAPHVWRWQRATSAAWPSAAAYCRHMITHQALAAQAAEIRRLHALGDKLWPGVGHFSARHDKVIEQWHVAVAEFYAPLAGVIGRMRKGDAGAVDDAVTYLEARPKCFNSGYVAEELMRALSRAQLSEDHKTRLRAVVIAEANNVWTRGHKYAGALAGSVWNEEVGAELKRLGEKVGGERATAIARQAGQWLANERAA